MSKEWWIMEDNKIDKNALTEVYTILTELELYNKIPNELQEYIYVNKNNEYKFSFNKKGYYHTYIRNILGMIVKIKHSF